MKITNADIPTLREYLIKVQNGKCCLCSIDLSEVTPCLDHDHETGHVRGVLCNNCNGIEGKITNLARRAKRDGTKKSFLVKVLEYWDKPQNEAIHPAFKNKDEKRLLRNKRARKKNKKK